MNEKIQKYLDKARGWLKKLKEQFEKILNNAFPETERKTFFLVFMVFGELLLMYLLAVLDIGIWKRDNSIGGMISAYITDTDNSYPFLLFLLLSAVLWFSILYYLSKKFSGNTGRGFDISESNVYGSAREINMEELQQITDIVPKEAAMGTILGQLDTTETKLITSKQVSNFNNNLLVLAPPGSGKTATIVLNYIASAIRRGESIVTTDTKGEVWSKTVELARKHGYLVRRLDLKNPQCSDGWNILGELRRDDIRAKIASKTIMRNTGDERDIHASAEEALLTALCLFTELHPSIPPEEKTLYNAYSMLFSGSATLDATFDICKDDPEMRVVYESYATSIQGSPNLRGNIVTNLLNRLSIFSSPAIRELTSTPDIDLLLPGQQKCIYYVVLPDQHNSMKLLSSLFFSFLFWNLCDYADALPGQRLPVPVNVMIEEAYACGELPTITNALATVRSRGISVAMIAQGIDQFHLLYGEEMTNSILECCATYACLGTNTQSTASLFSWLAGKATVKVKTEQHTVGESPFSFGRAYSTGDGRQDLFPENDIRKMPFQQILLVWQRFDPIMAHTFFYKRHPEYLKGNMPEILANTHIPLSDKEARAYLRAAEEQRIQDYDAWLKAGGNPWEGYSEPKPQYDGPARGTPIPAIKPYLDLEKEALAHSKQASAERAEALMEDLQREEEVPPAEGFEPVDLPEAFQWTQGDAISYNEEDLDEPVSEDTDAGQAAPEAETEDSDPSTPENPSPSPQAAPDPVVLDAGRGVSASLFGIPGDDMVIPIKRNPEEQPTSELMKGVSKIPK